MALSMTRRGQLKGLLDNLIAATYARLGLKKKAEEALKKTKAWTRREEVRKKVGEVIERFNIAARKTERDMIAIVKTLGPVGSKDDDDDCPLIDLAEGKKKPKLGIGIKIVSPMIDTNPVDSLSISEHDGKMVLHYGEDHEYHRHGRVDVPRNVFAEELIGSAELHDLVSALQAEFTAALTEKEILALLMRAKADLGAIKA